MRVQRIELCAQPWEGYILATIRYPRIVWSRCPDLNRRPTLYESAALPTELQRHNCAPTDYTIPYLRNKLTKGVASEAKSWYDTWSLGKIHTRARSEVGLSRLPVTEEIAGSNPVGPATKQVHLLVDFFRGNKSRCKMTFHFCQKQRYYR